jgi:RimJ/RimL family protein N-acetyltransferase
MPAVLITPSGRIRLRRPTPEDAGAVFLVHGDPETNTFNPGGPDRDLEVSRRRLDGWLREWEEHGLGYHVAEDAATGEPLGITGVRVTDARAWGQPAEPVLNLYYRFRPVTWGTGIAREAAAAVLDAVTPWRPEPVVAVIRPVNVPSTRLARRLGLAPHRDVVLEGAASVEHRAPVYAG